MWMIENKILKKKKFTAKIALGQALIPPLVKAKNQHQNFEKHLKDKRCARSKTFKCSKLLLFFEKFRLTW